MTVNCPLCGTPAADNTPLATAVKFAAWIDSGKGNELRGYSQQPAWYGSTWEGISDQQNVGVTWNTGDFDVTVIAKHVSGVGEDQGNDTRVAFLVLEVNGHLIRKDGCFDSYGDDVTWNGPCRPVTRQEKVTTEYVYE